MENKMKKLKVLAIVAVTGLVGMNSVYANSVQDVNDAPKYKKLKPYKSEMKRIFQKLELNDTQKEAIKSNRKSMRLEMKTHRKGMHGHTMERMGEFISKEGFDKKAFILMRTKNMEKVIKIRANNFVKLVNILTPEQRVKLVEVLQEKKK